MKNIGKNVMQNLLKYLSYNDIVSVCTTSKQIKSVVSQSAISIEFPNCFRNLICPSVCMLGDIEIADMLFNGSIQYQIRRLNLSFTQITDKMVDTVLRKCRYLISLTINSCPNLSKSIFSVFESTIENRDYICNCLEELNMFNNNRLYSTNERTGLIFAKLRVIRFSYASDELLYRLLLLPTIELIQSIENIHDLFTKRHDSIQCSQSLKLLIYPCSKIINNEFTTSHPVLTKVLYMNTAYSSVPMRINDYLHMHQAGYRQPLITNFTFFMADEPEQNFLNMFSTLRSLYSFNIMSICSHNYDCVGWAIINGFFKLAKYLLSTQNNVLISHFKTKNESQLLIYDHNGEHPVSILGKHIYLADDLKMYISYGSIATLAMMSTQIIPVLCSIACWIKQSNKENELSKYEVPLIYCPTHFRIGSKPQLISLIEFQNKANIPCFAHYDPCNLDKGMIKDILNRKITNFHNTYGIDASFFTPIYNILSQLLHCKQLELELLKNIGDSLPTILTNEKEYHVNNSYNSQQKTLLIIAIEAQCKEVYKYLIQKQYGLDLTDKCMWTPLHQAVASNNIEAAQLLLEQPQTNVNAKEWNNKTPLYVAAQNNLAEMVQLLQSHKASTRIKDINSKNPYNVAVANGCENVLKEFDKKSKCIIY